VFGLASQTLQGADLLAARLNAVVLVPDFFEGDALKHEYLPADTAEKQKIISDFMAHRASIPRNVEVLLEAVQQYKRQFSSVEHWGAFGLCWGGKVNSRIKDWP
jgi:dienelactone hydrolase